MENTVINTADKPKLDFDRFEFKYILIRQLRERIENDLQHFMTLDPFVASQPQQNYIVRSLYYDDPAFSSYHQKIDGTLRRSKFRLRTYTNDPEDTCATYLEIKGRHNQLVFKHRTGIDAVAGSHIFAGCHNTTDEILKTICDSPVSSQFRYELARKHIQPIMLIDYTRRPYFSRHDPEFRLTIDSELHGTRTNLLFPHAWQNRRMLLPGYSVMEIKFKDRIPLWFHRMIKNYNLQRRSISKVCKGVEAWNLVPLLD